jgi:hypothetical protein
MQHLADLTDPMVNVDFGAAQAQRRFAAHGDAMGAFPTMQTAVLDRAHLVGIPAPEHLVHETVIVARIIARIEALKPGPVLGKDLFENIPGRRGFCSHQAASLQSVGLYVIGLFYHIPPTISTPSSAFTGAPAPTSLIFEPRGLQGNPQMGIPMRSRYPGTASRPRAARQEPDCFGESDAWTRDSAPHTCH